MEFPDLFRKLRKAKRVTLREMHEYIGLSIGYLSDIEHDRKAAPDLETVRKLEIFFNITDSRLIKAAQTQRNESTRNINKLLNLKPHLRKLVILLFNATDEKVIKLKEDLIDEQRKRRIERS